jgi:hypothetical protein
MYPVALGKAQEKPGTLHPVTGQHPELRSSLAVASPFLPHHAARLQNARNADGVIERCDDRTTQSRGKLEKNKDRKN